MYDVVIIGAGIAGLTAAIYAARAGKSVLVLEAKVSGGQIISTLNIENYPAMMGVSGAELGQKLNAQALELGAKIEYEEVLGVAREGEGFVVRTDEGEHRTKEVIIATGTEPRKLGPKQAAQAGKRLISYCATCDGAFFKGKPVAVIGSGNTAKHEMRYLKGLASKVYHIHHDDPIPEDAAAIFVAIGRVPATAVFADLVELDDNGYIVAGEDCKTSCPGVYVAGDCRAKNVRQLVTAAGDGAVAAANLN